MEGTDEAETLAREEALVARLQPMISQGELDSLQAVSSFVPSPQRQRSELEARRRRAPALESALKQLGMRPEAIQTLRQDLAKNRLLTVEDWLQAPFSTPFRHLWMGKTNQGTAALVVPMGTAEGPRLREVAQGLPGVVLVDKAASVSTMLAKDRRMATWSLGGALFLVWGLLALWYGPRAGFWLIAPPWWASSWPWRARPLSGLPSTSSASWGSSWCWAGGWTTRSSSGDAKAGTARASWA